MNELTDDKFELCRSDGIVVGTTDESCFRSDVRIVVSDDAFDEEKKEGREDVVTVSEVCCCSLSDVDKSPEETDSWGEGKNPLDSGLKWGC